MNNDEFCNGYVTREVVGRYLSQYTLADEREKQSEDVKLDKQVD